MSTPQKKSNRKIPDGTPNLQPAAGRPKKRKPDRNGKRGRPPIADPQKKLQTRISFYISEAQADSIRTEHPGVNLNYYARDRFFGRRNRSALVRKEINDIWVVLDHLFHQLDTLQKEVQQGADPALVDVEFAFVLGRMREFRTRLTQLSKTL